MYNPKPQKTLGRLAADIILGPESVPISNSGTYERFLPPGLYSAHVTVMESHC